MPKEDYVKYYEKTLNLSPCDFSNFCRVIGEKLPYSFRVTRTPLADTVRRRLERYGFLKKVKYLEDVYMFHKVEDEDDLYSEFVSFLVDQTAVGLIQRQEIVSMVPVTLLDIKEDSKVLDMCAAPGSKTKQILEAVGDRGLVVANDQNGKRLNVLVSETSKRPRSSLVITKHDASSLPNMYADGQVKFDYVLCDVPCSSDGTVRKNPSILGEWDLSKSTGLFSIQYRILKRGCGVMSDNGMLVYSTCSLNPVENECVVQKILLEGELELVDLRNDSRLSLFSEDGNREDKITFREGLTTWGTDDKIFENGDFQPSGRNLGLENCIRLYPHDQDTGGFFISVFRKRAARSSTGAKDLSGKCFPSLHFLPEEYRDELSRTYSVQIDGALYKRTRSSSHIDMVSSTLERIIKGSPKLKVISAGYRLFEKSGLEHSEFYLKNLFYIGNGFQCRLELSLESFKVLLEGNFVRSEVLGFRHTGLAIVRVKEIGITLCGYGNSSSFTVFMNKNLRKALKGLFCHEAASGSTENKPSS